MSEGCWQCEAAGARPLSCCGCVLRAEGDFTSTLCRLEGSVFPVIFLKSLVFAGIGAGAWVLYSDEARWYAEHIGPNTDLHTYMGILVSLMLSFRTNACYGRYVEGIHASNRLKTIVRDLMIQAAAYIDGTDAVSVELLEEIRRLLMLYCVFFKRHLHDQDQLSLQALQIRGGLSRAEHASLESCTSDSQRVMLVMLWLRRRLAKACWVDTRPDVDRDGSTADDVPVLRHLMLSKMDDHISAGLHVFQESCRIAFVPMPFPYAQVVKFVLLVFLTITPFAFVSAPHQYYNYQCMRDLLDVCQIRTVKPAGVLKCARQVDDLQEGTPIGAFFLAMIFLSVDEISVEIENPFGRRHSVNRHGVRSPFTITPRSAQSWPLPAGPGSRQTD
eukprot:COSAG01_NODE_10718_length_2095_cov_3.805611_1_plen_387_part_00